MTDTSKVTEIDCSTGIETTRDMTPAEIAAREAMQADFAARQAEEAEAAEALATLKASAKAKLIAGKPLTEEEAGVLVL